MLPPHVYLKVIQLVEQNITGGLFADNAFLECMDVIFVGLYLRGSVAGQGGGAVLSGLCCDEGAGAWEGVASGWFVL